jgi:uncharacterized protein
VVSSIFFPKKGAVHSILFVSSGIIRPPLPARRALQSMLDSMKENSLFPASSLTELPKLPVRMFQAVVLFFHEDREKLNPDALDVLDQFVRDGGGLLAINAASASFKDDSGYQEILGGHLEAYGPEDTYTISPTKPQDDLFGEIPGFEVHHKVYLHACDPENRIHFHTDIDGRREPVVWTREHGAGRVCYCALGHKTGVLLQPSVMRILQRGLQWVRAELPPELREQ